MDKGAHFYKCDFQVHTPRDINWSGRAAVSVEERTAYSEQLVLACRKKGINAIAITDHHDFVFFPFIKKAAENELDSEGAPISPLNKLIVFPGLELTLSSPPCQAILILDHNFPENLLTGVLTAIGVEPNHESESRTAQVKVISAEVAQDFKKLYDRLSSLEYLKNRFTVLPNMTDGGHKTLLRSGFSSYYKSMPCVGGYLDGPIDKLGKGNISILNGENRDYGFKPVGLFQTSDNRKANHDDLGRHTTWVKWAEPTAEALRQACLAKTSRISQVQPQLPPISITSIDVSNSKFLGQVYLEFNEQYNAIIGGRGTGKSTVLEYLRWGLCDQLPAFVQDGDDIPSYQERRKKLIEKTLFPFDATVQVSFLKNDILHVVRRKSTTKEILLKIGASEFEICKEEDIRNLLPIQAYSQKQLSAVGVSVEELKRLTFSPVRQSLSDLDLQAGKIKNDLKSWYDKRLQKKVTTLEIEKNELELKSLSEQVEKLRKDLLGITETDRVTIEVHESYEALNQITDEWISEIQSGAQAFKDISQELVGYPTASPSENLLPESESRLLVQMHNEVSNLFEGARRDLEKLGNQFRLDNPSLIKFNSLLEAWKPIVQKHEAQYELAKKKSTSQEATLVQIRKLEDRIKEIRKSISDKKQKSGKSVDPDQNFQSTKEEWKEINRGRANIIDLQCAQLEKLSDRNLRATLSRGKGTEELAETLRSLLSGSNIRKDKIQNICTTVSEARDPIHTWHEILLELEYIAEFEFESTQAGVVPITPLLSSAGFIQNDIVKMTERINPTNWIDLCLVKLEDIPTFSYRTRDGEYIEFTDASAGQQATALIHVLLNQDGPPLIIDQPEDDLDNQMVSEIADLVCKAKSKRQIIFSSHNANIVVNGDAELVACFDYKVSGDQSKGGIKKEGAIDVSDIRSEITTIMEGGEKAFRLRKEKYGY